MPDTVAYHTREGLLPPTLRSSVAALYAQVFETDEARVQDKLVRDNLVSVIASEHDRVVGFKIGYPQKKALFYSWLGGVHPAHRGRGIGKELMHRQHTYCRRAGFRTVRTKTTNRWRAMLLLNIRCGFHIIGTYVDERGEIKIMLEKKL